LALEEEEELMGKISPPPQPVRDVAAGHLWWSKGCSRDTTLPSHGQALASDTWYLCKIWWRLAHFASSRPHPPAPAASVKHRTDIAGQGWCGTWRTSVGGPSERALRSSDKSQNAWESWLKEMPPPAFRRRNSRASAAAEGMLLSLTCLSEVSYSTPASCLFTLRGKSWFPTARLRWPIPAWPPPTHSRRKRLSY